MLVSSIIQMILGKGRRITPAKPTKDAKLHLDNQSLIKRKEPLKSSTFGVTYY